MSRLSKKFIRPDAVDGTKIKLSNDEALRAANAEGNGVVSFLKVNSNDKPEFLILPVLGMEPTDSTQAARKGYVDTKAETEASNALSSANSYTDSAISSLVNGAPALLDTLKELADALGSDENFAVTIGNQISALDGRLDVIEGSELTEGSVLWAKKSSFDYTDAEIAQEVIDRDAAIGVAQTFLQGEIDQEITDREAAVQAEEEARIAADDLLDGRLDILEGADTVEGSVAKAEKDAKDHADSIVATEQSAREGADAIIQVELDNTQMGAGLDTDGAYVPHSASNFLKVTDFADYTLDQNIHNATLILDILLKNEMDSRELAVSTEETNRMAADDALDARLDVLEGDNTVVGSVAKSLKDSKDYTDSAITSLVNGAPALLDTLKELADALGGDENFAVTIAGQISGLDSRLDTLEGADTVSGSLLWGIKQAKDYTDAEVAQEVIDRDAAIAVEAGLREDADDALDARLDVIEGVGAGSISKALQDAKDYADGIVDTEETARIAGDDALDARLDVIEGDSSTVGSIAKAQADAQSYADGIVASEQSARELADENLQDQLDTHDAEITDLQDAVTSLNSGTFHKQKKVLGSGDITNGYVDLAYAAKAYSTMVFVQGAAGGYMHEGDDYTVSTVGGVTRITFAGDFASGGSTALDASDVLYVQFQYVP